MSKRHNDEINDNNINNQIVSSKRQSKPVKLYDPIDENIKSIKTSSNKVTVYDYKIDIPLRNNFNELIFQDHKEFKPNLTPKEILQLGSFGGTYFRSIKSGVTGLVYKDVWQEFPSDWFEGLNISKQVTSSTYYTSVNKFKEKCGGDLDMWESSGWIVDIDPYGWFQWYCRFYLGRRTSDDDRQISRGLGLPPEKAVNDPKISPKIRQLLQHWGYHLTLRDLQQAIKEKK
eukprot:gene18076-23724_t